MKNVELRQLVFDKIEALGYKIKNVTHPDGYFICDMGKDSVTHFRLKGHFMSKHWLFGLWVEEDYLDPKYVEKCDTEYQMRKEDMHVIQLFAQYDTCIDKFKPSRSALCLQWDMNDIENYLNETDKNYLGESYTFNKIKSMLGFMCKHPLLAYDEFCGEYAGYKNGSFLWDFIKYEYLHKWRVFKKYFNVAIWAPYTKVKCIISSFSKVINNIEFLNFEKENPGLSTSYLYEVNIRFKESATDEQMDKWLDFWWHRKKYGKHGYYDYVVEINDITKVGTDEIWFIE